MDAPETMETLVTLAMTETPDLPAATPSLPRTSFPLLPSATASHFPDRKAPQVPRDLRDPLDQEALRDSTVPKDPKVSLAVKDHPDPKEVPDPRDPPDPRVPSLQRLQLLRVAPDLRVDLDRVDHRDNKVAQDLMDVQAAQDPRDAKEARDLSDLWEIQDPRDSLDLLVLLATATIAVSKQKNWYL